MAKHILRVAQKSAKVVFENEAVRVIEVTTKKGQNIPMHSHNRGLSYSLDERKIRPKGGDGKSRAVNVRKGGGLLVVSRRRGDPRRRKPRWSLAGAGRRVQRIVSIPTNEDRRVLACARLSSPKTGRRWRD